MNWNYPPGVSEKDIDDHFAASEDPESLLELVQRLTQDVARLNEELKHVIVLLKEREAA